MLGLQSLPILLAATLVAGKIQTHSSKEPIGSTKTIGGIVSYVSIPPSNITKNFVLFVPDAFGLAASNNKLYADDLARNGYHVVMPDIFDNDPSPPSVLTNPFAFDGISWASKHTPARVDKIVDQTIAGMRSELGAKRIGSVGFCFGAKYTVRFMAEGKGIDVAFVAHPTGLEDTETNAIVGPISIAGAENDMIFGKEKRRATEDVLFKKTKPVPFQVVVYGGTEHGFSVQTEFADAGKKFAKEAAFSQALRWLDQWL